VSQHDPLCTTTHFEKDNENNEKGSFYFFELETEIKRTGSGAATTALKSEHSSRGS